jgi:hypothetical protein
VLVQSWPRNAYGLNTDLSHSLATAVNSYRQKALGLVVRFLLCIRFLVDFWV